MNVNQEEALTFVLLGMSLMFFGRLSYYVVLGLYRKFMFELEYMKHPRLVNYDQQIADYLCPEFHDWQSAQLVLRGLPVGMYKVCKGCGTIMGNSEFMVSKEVLEKIAEANKLAEQKLQLERQVQARIDSIRKTYVDHYIARNFVKEVNDVHMAERLRALSDYTITALADASEKVAAELTGQAELEDRYKDWPKTMGIKSNQKGNA